MSPYNLPEANFCRSIFRTNHVFERQLRCRFLNNRESKMTTNQVDCDFFRKIHFHKADNFNTLTILG